MVDIRSHLPPLSPPSPSPPPFAFKPTKPPGHEPLLSVEGCGLNRQHFSLRSEDAAAAPPLSKGMWAAYPPHQDETTPRHDEYEERHDDDEGRKQRQQGGGGNDAKKGGNDEERKAETMGRRKGKPTRRSQMRRRG